MRSFLFKRFFLLFLTIFGVMIITFFLSRLLHGDPALLILGEHPTAEQIKSVNEKLGLNKPLLEQFWIYISDMVKGDLGISLRTKNPVSFELGNRFTATFELVTIALFLAILIGFPLGVLSAYYRNTKLSLFIRTISFTSFALPVFWSGMLLQILLFGKLGWFPLQGRLSAQFQGSELSIQTGILVVDTLLSGNWEMFLDAVRHIALPVICLSFSILGIIIRTVRSAVLENIQQDYFMTYQTFGFDPLIILFRLALRNSLILSITVVGLVYGMLLGGSFLVESIFDWPGLGHFGYLSISASDLPSVMGVTILYSAVYVMINFLVDIGCHYLDPRLRIGEAN